MQLFIYLFFFQNVFLGLQTRRLLKADAIPTIFVHDSQTVSKKRIPSIRKEAKADKQQVRLFSMINFASFLLSIAFKSFFQ